VVDAKYIMNRIMLQSFNAIFVWAPLCSDAKEDLDPEQIIVDQQWWKNCVYGEPHSRYSEKKTGYGLYQFVPGCRLYFPPFCLA
jgi:hypothetical protein